MLYRISAAGIVAFWLVMMTALVRLETHPEATDVLDVPASYVARLMFRNAQQSLLTVCADSRPIGSLSLRPASSGSNTRTLDFSGSISLPMPASHERQRFNFNGSVALDGALRMRDFHAELLLPQQHGAVTLTGDTRRFHYEARVGDRLVSSRTLPMDPEQLKRALAADIGLSPDALPIDTASIAPPVFTANEARMKLRGEELQVYEITMRQGSVQGAEIYFSQLGQVIKATLGFGFTLTSEELQ